MNEMFKTLNYIMCSVTKRRGGAIKLLFHTPKEDVAGKIDKCSQGSNVIFFLCIPQRLYT